MLPFVRFAIALMVGICLYVGMPQAGWLPIVLAIGGMGLLVSSWAKPQPAYRLDRGLGALLLLVAIGWQTAYWRTAANRPDNLIRVLQPLRGYVGVVDAQPEERAKTYRVELALQKGSFTDAADSSRTDWRPMSGRVIVYLDRSAGAMPRYGDVWLVGGSPRIIDPPLNPGEFNYKRFLSFRGIYHQQYLRPFQRQPIGHSPPNRLITLAIRANQWADSLLTRRIGSKAEYAIVNAMTLGVRDDLDAHQYRAYAIAGAVHILSVSGMHVGILFLVLSWLIGKLAGKRDDRWWLIALQLAILWFYALVAGFSLPVLRSAAMVTMFLIAKALQRNPPLLNTLAVAIFFILLYDPYALFSAGFQLSCLAVGGIGAWQSGLYQSVNIKTGWVRRLWQLTAVALVAQLATFPLAVFYFHQFPTYFLLANPLIMFLSMVLLPLAMLTLALGFVPILNAALGWLLQQTAWLLNTVVTAVGRLPGAAWEGLWLNTLELVLVYGLIFAATTLLLSRRRAWLWVVAGLSVVWLIAVSWHEYGQQHQRKLAVHFLPHRTAVSFTDGMAATLLTDWDSSDVRSYDFYLKNTFGQWGIRQLAIKNLRSDTLSLPAAVQTRDYVLYVWKGYTFLIVNRLSLYSIWQMPMPIDYLIIRRNALRDWSQLRGRIAARHIIFDDSNRTPLTDALLADARQRGIACYSVRQQGAYVREVSSE